MKDRKISTLTFFIIIIALILVVTLVIIAISTSSNNNSNNKNNSSNNKVEENKKDYEEDKTDIDLKGNENVEVKENGNTINISNELKKDKKLGNLIINNIQVGYYNNETRITGKIRNNTSSDIQAGVIKAKIKDSNSKVFLEIDVYIGKVKSNTTRDLNITTGADISNMKDIEFVSNSK